MAAHLAPPDAPCCHVGRVVIAGRPARERGRWQPRAKSALNRSPVVGRAGVRCFAGISGGFQRLRRKGRHPEPWPLIVVSRKRILRATRSLAPVIAVRRGAGAGLMVTTLDTPVSNVSSPFPPAVPENSVGRRPASSVLVSSVFQVSKCRSIGAPWGPIAAVALRTTVRTLLEQL